ncbi:hypothetical protein [Thermoanaerobacterium butyriciformans]|uniref:Ig-like domain-containing protein n=1 Tax=Thermoanaerobacterium butyriciformans TaxID=1702242 RepID=A0ABS4NAZ6_9THEO|nr:hypothetical protein [Thermoanaerobacterium butyriciformans]MBP2070839.1 hypothetical protein [Thermoanaerobacterium butyriciformans]
MPIMTEFQNFAVMAVFDTTAFQNFIKWVQAIQRNQPQTEIVNTHTDTNPHTDSKPHTDTRGMYNQYSQHSDTGHYHYDSRPHTDGTGSHTDSTPHTDYHSDSNSYVQGNYHYDLPGGNHVDTWNNAYTHTNNGVRSGHYQTHDDRTVHSDGYSHGDKYNQWNTHTDTYGTHTDRYSHNDYYGSHSDSPSTHGDSYPHTDYTPHTDTTTHTDTTSHTDTGFNHDNFVPSSPAFFNVDSVLKGTVTIGLYSYDKNIDGYGTQDTQSKTVYYDLYIRKVMNLDGSSSVSAWKTLINNQIQESDGGLTYNLNTIDPLGTGNTTVGACDGYYEIKAVARNLPISGVTFQSQEQVVTVLIRQDAAPTLTVQNGNEFINFIFGYNGALSPDSVYKKYGSLYPDANSSQQNGIFVRFTMNDADTDNWQKGQAYLIDNNGNPIAGTTVDIIWDNGSTIIASDGQNKTGYAFIPASAFTSQGISYQNAKVVLKVQDFLDSNCTRSAGATIVQSTVSSTDQTQLLVNIDVVKPSATLLQTKKNSDNSLTAYYYIIDDFPNNVQTAEYAVTNSPSIPQTWQTAAPYQTITNTINQDGTWFIHYHAIDKLGNETYGYFGPYTVDVTAPTINASYTINNNITINVTADDKTTGVDKIVIEGVGTSQNVNDVNPYTATFTVPAVEKTYTIDAYDKAGNKATTTLTVVPMSLTPSMQTVYAAGQAMVVQVNVTGNPDSVTAQMWYNSNDYVNTGTTTLINEGNGLWCTRHDSSQGYDKVVIIPKNTPDGTYNITVTATKTVNSQLSTKSITIPITVKGTIYDYYHSEINGQ